MLKTRRRGNLIIISGPGGAGKNSIIRSMIERNNNYWLSISVTSREKRSVETEGVEYYFISKNEFEEKIENNELLEYTKFNDNYYGTLKFNVEEKLSEGTDVILEIDVYGAVNIKQTHPEALFIFILPPSMKELKRRYINRGIDSKERMLNRFKIAYQEINEINKYNYVVVNDIVEEAVKKIEAILIAQKCRVDRIEELDINNIEEVMHEELVDLN